MFDLDHCDMAARAQEVLDLSGSLPDPLRTPNRPLASASRELDAPDESSTESASVASAATGCEAAMGDAATLGEDEPATIEPHIIAAE